MKTAKQIESELQKIYQRIQDERMAAMPIINLNLSVKAINFRLWNDYFFGVLLTPWFMNLMLIPEQQEHYQNRTIGEKKSFQFPSGNYEFIINQENDLGYYLSCSLFSPMFAFADQQTAVQTAEQVMIELMDEKNIEQITMREKEIKQIWLEKPDEAVDSSESELARPAPVKSKAAVKASLKERMENPISRRDLLRGSFLKE